MKKRNELPNYKKISLTIDKDKILKVLEDNKDKLVQYRDSLNVKCATPYLSELYEQIPITELTEGSDYTLPLAGHRDVKYDERNYTTLVECLRGTYVEEVIKMFKSTAVQRKDEQPELLNMKADGSVYFVNQGYTHSAWNFGKEDCIRLIVAVNGLEDLY